MVALRRLCLSFPSFVFALCLFGSSTAVNYSAPLDGSTPGLKEIFIGRCYDYLALYKGNGLYPAQADQEEPGTFCADTWEVFRRAFAGQHICTVPAENYRAYFDKTGAPNITNKALFWSGTFKLSSAYAAEGRRAVPLAYTLTGYLVTELNWCGDHTNTTSDGIKYDYCPRCRTNDADPAREGFEVFWGLASEEFAKKAGGLVRHLVTCTGTVCDPRGCPRVAFHNGTFFYKHELPNLNPLTVARILVILANEPGTPVLEQEHCGSGSLAELKREIDARGIPNECVENPWEIRHLMCVDKPGTEPQCAFRNPPANARAQSLVAKTSYRGFNVLTKRHRNRGAVYKGDIYYPDAYDQIE